MVTRVSTDKFYSILGQIEFSQPTNNNKLIISKW